MFPPPPDAGTGRPMNAVASSAEATLAPPVIAAPSDFADRARLAVAWATSLQFFRDVIQFALTVTLVRLLPTSAYGQFGLLTTLLTFFTYYSFREFVGYTLQVRDGEAVHYQDHFTAGAVIQTGIVVIVNLVAVAFRWMPDYAPVSPVLHVMSVLFVIDLPAEFRARMLERALDWRRLRVLQAVGFVSGAALSLLMALGGLGVWALIVPTLVVPLPFVHDLFVRERWRPTWEFSWTRFRPAWKFGTTRILTLTLLAAASLTETLSLTSALGFALFGIFGRAIGLAQLLCGRIASLLSLAIYPVLTRVDPASDTFRRAGSVYLRGVSWSVVPAAAAATLFADAIVHAIYGSKWVDAIPLVPWAMAAAAGAALVQTAYTVLLAGGRQRACVAADGWRLAGTIVAVLLFLPLGAGEYLAAMCAVHAVALGLVGTILWRDGVLSGEALQAAAVPAAVSAATATIVVVTLRALVTIQWGAIGAAAALGPLFVVTYVVVLRLLFPSPLRELVSHLPQSRRASRLLRLHTHISQ